MESSRICVFDFNLIYDLTSLIVAILKHSGIEHAHPTIGVIQQHGLLNQLFQYMPTIKPQVGALETLHFLEKNRFEYYISMDNELIRHQMSLKDKDLSTYKQIIWFVDSTNDTVDPNITKFLVKNHRLKDNDYWQQFPDAVHDIREIDWQELLGLEGKPDFIPLQYTVSLSNQQIGLSTIRWSTYIELQPKVSLQSKVVKGFGRGSKELGIPTVANLETTPTVQEQIKQLLPGIYVGRVMINQRTHGTVMSIGYNPFYQNKEKTIEAHVIGYDSNDFYDTVVELDIQYFLRVESDFKHFGYLIEYINNDVYQAKELIQQQHKNVDDL